MSAINAARNAPFLLPQSQKAPQEHWLGRYQVAIVCGAAASLLTGYFGGWLLGVASAVIICLGKLLLDYCQTPSTAPLTNTAIPLPSLQSANQSYPLYQTNYQGADQMIRFFSCLGTDDHQRSLADILHWSNEQLEQSHNYIQRLFLNVQRSQSDQAAPLLTPAIQTEFLQGSNRNVLQHNLRQCFLRMLHFYGFIYEGGSVRRNADRQSPHSFNRRIEWLWINDAHNLLRVTRILHAVKALGLAAEGHAFLATLLELTTDPLYARHIPLLTRNLWTAALNSTQ